MNAELVSYVTEQTNNLMNARSCSAEAKAAGQAWLDAVGTDREAEVTKAYLAELEEDILSIDDLIAFAQSPKAVKVFGSPEAAAKVEAHGRQHKAAGGKYCDCPACAACEAILRKKDALL